MGGDFSRFPRDIEYDEVQNRKVSAKLIEVRVMLAEKKHQETMRRLNATREVLLKEQEDIRRKEPEVEHYKASEVEFAALVDMFREINGDPQRIIDELVDKVNREQEDSQLEQKNLLKKLSEEYTENEKKMADTQEKIKKYQAEMI